VTAILESSNRILRLVFCEITSACNLRCAHCRRVETEEAAERDLTTEQAMDFIGNLAEVGRIQPVLPILIVSGGEPLCRRDVFEIVGRARSAGIACALATNGTMVDSDMAQRIAEAGIARVSVSLDGATAEVHDRLRQARGSFDRALHGIAHLREKGVPFQINMTLTQHNAHQLEEVYDLAKALGAAAVHLFMLVPVGCGQILAETDMLAPMQYEQKMKEILQLENRGVLPIKVTCGPHYERIIRQQKITMPEVRRGAGQGRDPGVPGGHHGNLRGCLAGLGVLFVGHQGDVFPCGYLPLNCGNILNEKVSDIWLYNEKLAMLRDSDRLEGKCGVCGYREVCGGCRGRAYGMTGNSMAEEPFCAYIPPEARA
jgi:AdoMet-dependent heme synthase